MFEIPNEAKPRSGKARRKLNILDAASALASDVGYADVTMVDVAKQAGVGRMTLYRYYATKEHLFSELIVEWGRTFRERIHQETIPGSKVGTRVTWILRKTVAESAAHPYLIPGIINSMTSEDPGAKAGSGQWEKMMPSLLGLAMGFTSSRNQVLAGRLLHHTMISNMLLLHAGHTTFEKMTRELVLVAKFVLVDVWNDTVS